MTIVSKHESADAEPGPSSREPSRRQSLRRAASTSTWRRPSGAQRQADKWLISGSLLIGTAALGIFGLPLFLRGVWLLRKAQRDGLTVRPMLVTLIGYLVIIDAAINTVGWALDLVANHTILARILLNGWGAMFDAGYFWHYNELWLGGAAGPGREGHGSRHDPHRLHHADRRGDRIPADEALGPPVDDHHLLDGRGHLVSCTCST